MNNIETIRTKWTDAEVSMALGYVNKIRKDSGRFGISKNSDALNELARRLPQRTMQSVSNKCRSLMHHLDQKKHLEALNKERERAAEQAVKISIPLESLYGKVDYETFISLIK